MNRTSEGAIPVAEQHRRLIGVRTDRHQVRVGIAIEVADRHVDRARTDRKIRGASEGRRRRCRLGHSLDAHHQAPRQPSQGDGTPGHQTSNPRTPCRHPAPPITASGHLATRASPSRWTIPRRPSATLCPLWAWSALHSGSCARLIGRRARITAGRTPALQPAVRQGPRATARRRSPSPQGRPARSNASVARKVTPRRNRPHTSRGGKSLRCWTCCQRPLDSGSSAPLQPPRRATTTTSTRLLSSGPLPLRHSARYAPGSRHSPAVMPDSRRGPGR